LDDPKTRQRVADVAGNRRYFNMPNVDGGQSARSLASDDRTCRIPIVMLSSLLDRIPVEVRLGCAGLLAKPCSVDQLAQVLRAVIASHDSAERRT
jgi:CheY-like chemotaxis protein